MKGKGRKSSFDVLECHFRDEEEQDIIPRG